MNWKLKSLIRRTLTVAPGGHHLYRWLTSKVLGMQAGMATKWFRVIPNHVKVMQNHFGLQAREVSMWCFNCGATPAPAYAMAVASDRPGLLTDQDDRMAARYLSVSKRLLAEKGPELAGLTAAPPDRVATLLEKLPGSGDPRAIMEGIGMTYSADHATALEAPWRGNIGLMFSTGTLEHFTTDELEKWIAMVKQAMRPDGVLSHVVDHRDHRWHADKSISPLLQYTLSEEEFQQVMGNSLDYHNRWLRGDWVRFFESHGYDVECRSVHANSPELVQTDRASLAPAYQHATDSDLAALVTHFTARPRECRC
jgi:hypothetical protein